MHFQWQREEDAKFDDAHDLQIAREPAGAVGKNQGIRATFRRTGTVGSLFVRKQGLRLNDFKHYSAHDSGFARIRYSERVPVETNLDVIKAPDWPRLQRDEQYTLEFVAIGNRLWARCNGGWISVSDEQLADGTVGFAMDAESIRDIEVIDLDGLPEAGARKLAGVEEK